MKLTSQDFNKLEQDSWIDRATAERFGLYRVDSFDGAALVGCSDRENHAGLVFPIYWPGDSKAREYHLRRDHPPIENGKPKGKYLAPPGRGNVVLFGPDESVDVLDNINHPIILVEGLKKLVVAYRLARYQMDAPQFLACGISGVWNFRGTIGKTTDASGARVDEKGVIPDFDRISWTGRKVVVIYDSDYVTNRKVAAARHRLLAELTNRGAYAVALDLPALDGLDKTGFDDFLAQRGPEEALRLIQKAIDEGRPTPEPARLSKDDEATLEQLAALPQVQYDRIRKEEAEKLGIRTETLDHEVKARRPRNEKETGSGRALILPEVEQWSESVDGQTLMAELVSFIPRYVSLPRFGSVAITLWVLWSWLIDHFDIAPRMAVLSPEKRCGKTVLLTLLSHLTPRPLMASNITPSAIFRTVEAVRPTLLIDEADTFTQENEALRGILNSGHTRASATIIRTVGENFEPRSFSTWCPMVLAAIGSLPGTVEDRSIMIPMQRKATGEIVERLPQSGKRAAVLRNELHTLAQKIRRWTSDNGQALADLEPTVPSGLGDRASDNWRPLLAIADQIGGEWPKRARDAAQVLSGGTNSDNESAKVQLLLDIQTLFSKKEWERVGSHMLCEELAAMEERPWSDWKKGKPITPAQLARLLRPFGVTSRDLKQSSGQVLKGYLADDFLGSFSRYLPQESSIKLSRRYAATYRSQSNESARMPSATEAPGSFSENARFPALAAKSSAVANRTQQIEPEEVTVW
jgi:hypothetical protein